MNGIMSADFCWVPMWTPLVRYVSSGTRSPSAPIRSSSCILALDEPLLDPDELVQFRDPLAAHSARLDPEATEGDREMRDRREEIVPDHVARPAHELGEAGVAGEVVLVKRVLHAEEAVPVREVRDELDLLVGGERAVAVPVLPALEELGG